MEYMHGMADGCVDAVVTDPPYGVNFTGKAGHYRNNPNARRTDTYSMYEDTEENWIAIILPAIEMAISLADCAAICMAETRIFDMPKGNLGGFFMPNGCGRSAWGFQCFMHVVYYGRDPYMARGLGSRPNGKYGVYGNDSNTINHPCAKPLAVMRWLVARVSLPGQTVFDPFMGSGTTGVACVQTGRKFIGCEIDEHYFNVAKTRIEAALMQPRLLDVEPPPPLRQGELDACHDA